MHRRFQFGTRENTASPRQHAPRAAVGSLALPQSERVVENVCEGASGEGTTGLCGATPNERFVSADEAAQFLSVKRRYLLALARSGMAGAYPLGTGTKRKTWVFRLSELSAFVMNDRTIVSKTQKPCTIQSGSPR
jgi:hypothetical protein